MASSSFISDQLFPETKKSVRMDMETIDHAARCVIQKLRESGNSPVYIQLTDGEDGETVEAGFALESGGVSLSLNDNMYFNSIRDADDLRFTIAVYERVSFLHQSAPTPTQVYT